LLTKVPTWKGNLDAGHGGTYFAKNGGKFGKATVALLEWQFRGDEKWKAIALDAKAPGSLVLDNWKIEYKGFK
jgi:hypothetical protein